MSFTPFKHPRPFPFAPTGAAPEGDYWNFVTLPNVAEARRIFWLLKEITVTPTGTLAVPDYPAFSTTKVFAAVDPSDTDLVYHNLRGAISRGEPRNRVAATTDNAGGFDCLYRFVNGDSTQEEYGQIALTVAYVGGEFRLYYAFNFSASESRSQDGFSIQNPAFDESPVSVSGTFDFLGYSLDWVATISASNIPGVLSGAGISVTATTF